jgi:hypothetical protein
MSNESRTMIVVLLVCGLLVCGCIVLPLGLGAALFYVASDRAERAIAEQAVVAQREAARAQAEAVSAQNALQAALEPPASPLPASPPPDAPSAGPGGTSPPDASAAAPPITFPPLGELGDSGVPAIPPEVVAAMLADVEQRKNLYRAFKQLRDVEKLAAGDPSAADAIAGLKKIMTTSGLSQEQIDKILAEGDKEVW